MPGLHRVGATRTAWRQRPHLRFGRSGVQPFAEEYSVEAVLVGPVGFGVPLPRVVGEVLGHRRIGVEPNLWRVQGTGVVLSQCQQPRSDAMALGSRQHGTLSSSR